MYFPLHDVTIDLTNPPASRQQTSNCRGARPTRQQRPTFSPLPGDRGPDRLLVEIGAA